MTEIKEQTMTGEKVVKGKKTPTPVEQWDILAAKVIGSELAPKGFKKLESGTYRGLEIAKHSTPGITKSTVRKTQNLGASLVRGFREKLRKELNERVSSTERLQEDAIRNRDACRFWEISKKQRHQREYEHFRTHIGLLQIIISNLDKVDIK